jgi:hypothetical protein
VFDKGDCQVRDVDADPFALEAFRNRNGRAASAKGQEGPKIFPECGPNRLA